MKKYLLTAQGIAQLQEALFTLDDDALMSEAHTIADDFLSWLASHIELEVRLLEQLRSLPEEVRLRLGWCLASCVLSRSSFDIEVVKSEVNGLFFSAYFNHKDSVKDQTTMAINISQAG